MLHYCAAKTLSPKEVVESLFELDPTKKKIYVNWLVRRYIKGEFRLEDKRLFEELSFYDKLKPRLDDKDIGSLSYRSFSELLVKYQSVDTRSNNSDDLRVGVITILRNVVDGPSMAYRYAKDVVGGRRHDKSQTPLSIWSL